MTKLQNTVHSAISLMSLCCNPSISISPSHQSTSDIPNLVNSMSHSSFCDLNSKSNKIKHRYNTPPRNYHSSSTIEHDNVTGSTAEKLMTSIEDDTLTEPLTPESSLSSSSVGSIVSKHPRDTIVQPHQLLLIQQEQHRLGMEVELYLEKGDGITNNVVTDDTIIKVDNNKSVRKQSGQIQTTSDAIGFFTTTHNTLESTNVNTQTPTRSTTTTTKQSDDVKNENPNSDNNNPQENTSKDINSNNNPNSEKNSNDPSIQEDHPSQSNNNTPEHKPSTLCVMKCLTDSVQETIAEMDCQEYMIADWSQWLGMAGMTNCCLLTNPTSNNNTTTKVVTPLLDTTNKLLKNHIKNRVEKGIAARLSRINTLREKNNTHTITNHLVSGNSHRRMVSRYNSILASKSYDDIVINSRQYSGGEYSTSSSYANNKRSRNSNPTSQNSSDNPDYSCMIAECMEPITFYNDTTEDLECVYRGKSPYSKHANKQNKPDLCYDSDPGTNSTSMLLLFEEETPRQFEKLNLTLNQRMVRKRNVTNQLHTRTKSMPLLDISHEGGNENSGTHFPRESKSMYCDSLFEDDDDYTEEEDNLDLQNQDESYYHHNLEMITSEDLGDDSILSKVKIDESSSWVCSESSSVEEDDSGAENSFPITPTVTTHKPKIKHHIKDQPTFHRDVMYEQIQQALNETWLLTWHPTTLENKSSQPLSCSSNSVVSSSSSVKPNTNTNNESSSTTKPNTSTIVPSSHSSGPAGSASTTSTEQKNILKKDYKGKGGQTTTGPISQRCIQLWFERGNRIRNHDIVEPKLMWRDAYHPDLASKRQLNVSSTRRPYQICLLSICRIIETTYMDRSKYPFAKTNCSFLIRTCDNDEFLFEAENEQERDRTVNTWKLVVARLASQAVVGNGEGMLGEFFVSPNYSVP